MKITEEMKAACLNDIKEWMDKESPPFSDAAKMIWGHAETLRALLQPSPQPDTVTISRGTLERVRDSLTEWQISRATGNLDCEHEKATAMVKAIRSLINAEGKV